jgi:RimJ/RimL family protein N-acetyltransferase
MIRLNPAPANQAMDSLPNVAVTPVSESRLDEFFLYLNDHLLDNGTEETGYFHPRSRSAVQFPPDREIAFRKGLATPLNELAWRRAWTASGPGGRIIGHLDLRAHSEEFARHRCLLGMGVDRAHRKLGVGIALFVHAKDWALANTQIEWIDLHVLSANERALRFYAKAGFIKTGETPDMFRLDGRSFGDTRMMMRIRAGSGV